MGGDFGLFDALALARGGLSSLHIRMGPLFVSAFLCPLMRWTRYESGPVSVSSYVGPLLPARPLGVRSLYLSANSHAVASQVFTFAWGRSLCLRVYGRQKARSLTVSKSTGQLGFKQRNMGVAPIAPASSREITLFAISLS